MANEPAWRVATYTGSSGSCVEVASWRVASCTSGNGNCVEVGDADRAILVRDTKDRDGGTLTFTAATWQSFANSLK